VADRRNSLDKTYGVDRKVFKESFEELDKIYRVSEKEEIEKYRRIGKNA
jgi:hypothetical protein